MTRSDRAVTMGWAVTLLLGVAALCSAMGITGARSDAEASTVRAALRGGMTREETRQIAYERSVAYHCARETEDLYFFVTPSYRFGLGVGLRLRFSGAAGDQRLETVWDLEDSQLVGGELDGCPNAARRPTLDRGR